MANRIDLSNILINFLKKARYERHIEEGTLEENQFYAVTDGNEKTEYGDLFGNIENQADLFNALYASRLFKMEMCNDARGYDIVHKLYDRREFDPSKFTVVGSPTITSDGVASGFSGSNYIKVPYKPLGQNFKIFTPKFNSSDVSQTQKIVRYSDGNIRIEIYQNKIRLYRYSAKNVYDLPKGKTTLQSNTDYYYYVEQTTDGINYFFKGYISTDGISWNLDVDKTYSNPMYDYANSAPIQISGVDRLIPLLGSIDLKQFSITIDGTEVFNGLKDLTQYDTYTLPSSEVITIPYILSVDGVKIVDVAYKPLVDQLYAETGMGNYIIIDETNKTFRLPLPDIYSQIENKTSFTLRKWED